VQDREGRVEDRPLRIRAEVLPYDQCDADDMLRMLADGGFIARYEADGVRVIQVLAWSRHQNPHVKEGPSRLPCRCEHHASPGQAPDSHQTSTVQAPDEQQTRPEQARLIPDSGFLIPDSLENPRLLAQPCPRQNDEAPVLALVVDGLKAKPRIPDCPHQAVLALWAEVLPAMPQHSPAMWRGTRAKHLQVRWRESTSARPLWKITCLPGDCIRRRVCWSGIIGLNDRLGWRLWTRVRAI
jgi:hypothetical protein